MNFVAFSELEREHEMQINTKKQKKPVDLFELNFIHKGPGLFGAFVII